MRQKILGLIIGVSLLLVFTSASSAALVTFTILDLGSTPTRTIMSSGITLDLFNPIRSNGNPGIFFSDGDGLALQPDQLFDFNFTFDAPVSIVSYELGFVNPGVVGSFNLLGPNGNSTGNALNPAMTFPINGSFTLLAGQVGTFDTISLTGAGTSSLSQILRITVDDMPAAIPAPSAMLLMGTGLLGLIGWQRWRTKNV